VLIRSRKVRADRVGLCENQRHYVHGFTDQLLKASSTFADVDAIARSELYELTRNCRIGVELAAGRPFTLVNLVVANQEPERTERFRAGLNPNAGRFDVILWRQLLAAFEQPDWLGAYLAMRFAEEKR